MGDGLETEKDIQSELAAQEILKVRWNCTFRKFGDFSAIDWSMHRDGRLVAVAEFKRRYRDQLEFDTVYLNLQKWMALTFVSIGLEVPAYYIVHFNDGIGYVQVDKIDASKHRVCGREDRERESDIQPVISIKTDQFKMVKGT